MLLGPYVRVLRGRSSQVFCYCSSRSFFRQLPRPAVATSTRFLPRSSLPPWPTLASSTHSVAAASSRASSALFVCCPRYSSSPIACVAYRSYLSCQPRLHSQHPQRLTMRCSERLRVSRRVLSTSGAAATFAAFPFVPPLGTRRATLRRR